MRKRGKSRVGSRQIKLGVFDHQPHGGARESPNADWFMRMLVRLGLGAQPFPPVGHQELSSRGTERGTTQRTENPMAQAPPVCVSFRTVVSQLTYETFLMQVLGTILWDMLTCPIEFVDDIDKERKMLMIDFFTCGLMN